MPQIPEFIQEQMQANPELACEEACARNFFKALGIAPAQRKKLAALLAERNQLEHLPRDWDTVYWLLTRKLVTLGGSGQEYVRDLSAITVPNRAALLDALDSQLDATTLSLWTSGNTVVFFRFDHEQVVRVATCVRSFGRSVGTISSPFHAMRSGLETESFALWVVQTVDVFVKDCDAERLWDLE